MSLAREVNHELEWEEDCCDKEPAARRTVLITIVEEGDCHIDYFHAVTTISDYNTKGGGRGISTLDNPGPWNDIPASRIKQGLLDCLQDVVDSSFATINKDTDKGFVRAMASALKRGSLQAHHPSQGESGTIGQAWSPGKAFQPPTQCQDCVLGVASHDWSFRNITPSLLGRHSTDCLGHSTDCETLPDVDELPDVAKMYAMARGGRSIVGSEKTTESLPGDAAVTRPEVAGLHGAGPRCSQRTGCRT
jgi:hypothetical protein